MPLVIPQKLNWQPVGESDRNSVVREARRYCPEFPFEPSLVEETTNLAPFYTEDYKLVRFSAGENEDAKEVWGFYAPGDFYPIDGACRAFEELNEIAPLNLSLDTVLDYTLLRLRFELPAKAAGHAELAEFRLANIISKASDLPPGNINRSAEELNNLITEPTIEMAPEWELKDGVPSAIQPGRLFRVVVFAVVHYSATEWELIQVFAQIEPDGMLTIGRLDDWRRIVRVTHDATPEPIVFTTRRTRTAMPIKEWRVLAGEQADAVMEHLKVYGVGESASVPKGSKPVQTKAILRQAQLAFYKNWELLEVLIPNESSYRRSYAMIRLDNTVLHPLTGTSNILHEINQGGTEITITEETAEEYLRFFCWAIHSDGPFYVPVALREIPFLAGPSPEQRDALKQLNFNISRIENREADASETVDSGFSLTATVAYVSAAFETEFVVERTGMVRIIDDEPRVAGLVIYKDQYRQGSDDLFPLLKSEPKVIPPLTLVRKVILVQELTALDGAWSKLPAETVINVVSAPEIGKTLRKALEELPADWNDKNQALQFLKAQTTQSSAEESITPIRFREEVKSLIATIRPDKLIKSEILFQELADDGSATSRDIEDAVVLNTESVQARSRKDSNQYRSHVGLTISDCWFQSRLQLTTISDGTLVFERCVFEQGIFAEGAEIDKALRFINCVFIGGIAFDLENASISGPLSLINCSLEGLFFAPRLRARDHVQLLSCGISSSLSTISNQWTISQMLDRKWPDPEGEFEHSQGLAGPAINLVGARIDGSLEIRAYSEVNATIIYGSIVCDDIMIGQSLNITGTACEKLISFVRAQVSRLVDFTSLRILEGRLDCSYANIESDCRLLGTDVNGDVYLYKTIIGGNLGLLGLKSAGDLLLSFAKVGAFVAAYHQAPQGNLPALSVGGDLILSGAEAKAIEFRGAEIAGKIQIIRGKFDELILAVGAIPFRVGNSETGNNHVQRLVPRPCRTSVLEIASSQVQNLNVSGLVIQLPNDERRAKRLRMNHEGGFLLENSKIGQSLKFFTERIRETLERRWQRNMDQPVQWHDIPTSRDLGAEIWGNLILRSNEIEGGLDLRNIEVEGDIYLNDTSVGRDVDIDSGHPNFDGFKTRCNNFDADNLKCFGDLKLSGIRVAKDLRAKNANVFGDLVFLPGETKDRLDEGEDVKLIPGSQALIGGDLDLSGVDVRGDLDLRNLKLKGDILLNDTSVRFDLNMDGVLFEDFATECNNLKAEGLKCTGAARFSGLRTSGDLSARDIQVSSEIAFMAPHPPRFASIGGMIDLTAAKANRLTFSGNNLCTEIRAGDCDLQTLATAIHAGKHPFGVVLRDELSPATRKLLANGNGQLSEALEQGLVNDLNRVLQGPCLYKRQRFAGVKLSKETRQLAEVDPVDSVHVNRRILQELYPTKQKQPRVTLERAQIDHFQILNSSRFGSVNLSGVSVSNWVFPGTNGSGVEAGSAQDYIDLLNGLTPFDRSMWINVEKLLRNQSQVNDANKVYRQMRRKIKEDTALGPVLSFFYAIVRQLNRAIPEPLARLSQRLKSWWGRQYTSWLKPTLWHFWDRVQYLAIGYSTRVWIPMIPALVFFVISMIIFSQPKYVRASPSLVQVLQGNAPSGQTVNIQSTPVDVDGVHWSKGDGAILALRYHVPILNSLTQSWWEASATPLFPGFTAEHYASIVEFYHWIAWPIFLLGAAAQVFRGRQD